MTLADWLARSGISQTTLAKRCGVHPVTVAKWKSGAMTPRPAQMDALHRWTSGAVTAVDFQAMRGFAEDQSTLTVEMNLHQAILSEARNLGLDPETICEGALVEAISEEKRRLWREENREAIEAHHKWVEEHGVPLARYRMF
mgnify:CR=1 FL=1